MYNVQFPLLMNDVIIAPETPVAIVIKRDWTAKICAAKQAVLQRSDYTGRLYLSIPL